MAQKMRRAREELGQKFLAKTYCCKKVYVLNSIRIVCTRMLESGYSLFYSRSTRLHRSLPSYMLGLLLSLYGHYCFGNTHVALQSYQRSQRALYSLDRMCRLYQVCICFLTSKSSFVQIGRYVQQSILFVGEIDKRLVMGRGVYVSLQWTRLDSRRALFKLLHFDFRS